MTVSAATPRPDRPARRAIEAGFTLVEVLVTVVVLSVGILGLAGLQLAGMRNNESAHLRTGATLAAADLIDRMRVDPGSFSGRTVQWPAVSPGDGTAPPSIDAFNRWAAALTLPVPASGSAAAVNCKNSTNCGTGECEVTLSWDDSRAEPDASAEAKKTFTFRVCTRLPERIF